MNLPIIIDDHFDVADAVVLLPKNWHYLPQLSSLASFAPWYFITPFAFLNFASESNLLSKLKSIAPTSSEFIHKITRTPFPKNLHAQLVKPYHSLIKREFFSIHLIYPYSEFPSQTDYLPLKGDSVLHDRLRSIWGKALTALCNHHHQDPATLITHLPYILIQAFPSPDYSIRIYTQSPFTPVKKVSLLHCLPGYTSAFTQTRLGYGFTIGKTDDVFRSDTAPCVSTQHRLDSHGTPVASKLSSPPSPSLLKAALAQSNTLQNFYLSPVVVDLIIHRKNIYLLRVATPEPMLQPKFSTSLTRPKPILSGIPTSSGIVTAPVRVVKTPNGLSQLHPQEILVMPAITSAVIPYVKNLAGLVSETGGATSHIAIIAREFGLPAIMSTKNASSTLHSGSVYTLDGDRGEIYSGSLLKNPPHPVNDLLPTHATATRLLLDVTSPLLSLQASSYPHQGLGLVRGEVILSQMGIKLKTLLNTPDTQSLFQRQLISHLKELVQVNHSGSLTYKFIDLVSNERDSPPETNPFIGLRGSSWRLGLPKLLYLECQALVAFQKETGVKLEFILPFVRFPNEVARFKKELMGFNLYSPLHSNLIPSLDTPGSLSLLSQYAALNLKKVYLNLNHLTMLILGLDAENSDVNSFYDQNHPAVLKIVTGALAQCQELGLESYVYGDACHRSPHLIQQLVLASVSGLIVTPSSLPLVYPAVIAAENIRIQ